YLAACLTKPVYLQRRPVADSILNKNGEGLFVVIAMAVVWEVIGEIWRKTEDQHTRFAQLDWVVNYLFIDYAEVFNLDLAAEIQWTNNLSVYALYLMRGLAFDGEFENNQSSLRQ